MTPRDEAVLVGVMSGTSLDGITAAIARFRARGSRYETELLGVETIEYSDGMRERLAGAMRGASAAEYTTLAFTLGEQLAQAAQAVIVSAGIPRADIAAIASHGQTLWHAPPAGTWQIGEGAVIAERTGIDVIEDFRVRDVAAGGEGAPLVAVADALLFGRDDAPRALLNIGGIANVTVVPRLGDVTGVRAFDTGPGVAVIDTITMSLVGPRYDPEGGFARGGTAIEAVVERMLARDFFRREPPKSTGRETFGNAFALELMESCRAEKPGCGEMDILATATELTARSIALAFERFVPEPISDVLVSGGGTKNEFLLERINEQFAVPRPPFPVRRLLRFDDAFFPQEAKEAVAFAFLGFLHLRGEPGNVPSATGASGPRVLGKRVPA